MSYRDMAKECKDDKFLPILVMRVKDEVIIPVFSLVNVAVGFIKRNLPQEWVCGVVVLGLEEAQRMDAKGWKAIEYRFPRKLRDIVDFDVEILECEKVSINLKRA
jgi:hypothetical protein